MIVNIVILVIVVIIVTIVYDEVVSSFTVIPS